MDLFHLNIMIALIIYKYIIRIFIIISFKVKKYADRKRGLAKRNKERELNLNKLHKLKTQNDNDDLKEEDQTLNRVEAGKYEFHKYIFNFNYNLYMQDLLLKFYLLV